MKTGRKASSPFSQFLASLFLTAVIAISDAEAYKLPDTGQTMCYDSSGDVIACAGTGQDGSYSINPMSYADHGDGTVTDNNTGLMWQKCSAGLNNDATCSGTATTSNWSQAADSCTALTLGGHSDWRLPSDQELMGIVNFSISYPGPTINAAHFPNTKAEEYWSSEEDAVTTDNAWSVLFYSGSVMPYNKTALLNVRCVRGGAPAALVDNGNGTVTDNSTGLIWQKCSAGQNNDGTCGGTVSYYNSDQALSYCSALSLGGRDDWRLPNVKELKSLIDNTSYSPAIDAVSFPNTSAYYYWASTTLAGITGNAWFVLFDDGYVQATAKYSLMAVRCVRGLLNNKPAIGSLTPSQTASAAGVAQTFTAAYRDADGYADLQTVDFMVSPAGTGANAIWARYFVAANKLRLYNDAGTALLATKCTPGIAGMLQNSQGGINCQGTRVTGTGYALKVRWSITPNADFADASTPKQLKLKAADKAGVTSGWKVKGSWTINP